MVAVESEARLEVALALLIHADATSGYQRRVLQLLGRAVVNDSLSCRGLLLFSR